MLPSLAPFLIPLTALALSLVLFGGFVGLAGANVLEVYQSIYRGAFGTWFSWQNTLTSAAPLMLTALCTALPARLGLIVIGGEGAVVLGGLAAALTGLALIDVGPWVALTGMALAAMLTGGLLIGLVGWLRHSRNVNETISSLLFNYIGIAILSFLVIGPLRDPETLNKPSTHHIGDAHMLGALGESSIHWGFGFGLIACLILWVLYKRTVFGFAVDMVGGNVRAAKLSGLPVGRIVFLVCMMGGAAAGLAGMVEVAAVHGRANTSLNAGYGYEGILIAFAARHHPMAIVPMAILFGGIRAASGLMQRDHDLPDATSLVLQGIIFILILASEAVFARLAKRRGSPS
jgi:simple sugar transport system permease protein